MLASQHYGIQRSPLDDWFDPILNADTKLFIDPFLVFRDKYGWGDAHQDLINHFEHAFRLIAEGNLDIRSLSYKKAVRLLVFREPKEFCLGYTARGTAGSGGGRGYAASIAAAITEAIQRGLQHPRHFEELGILNEGIGADRISDITGTVLKARFVRYTQEVAQRHSLALQAHRVYASEWDPQRLRWDASEVDVLTNPATGGPLLLVPQRFLRDLPVLNADDWWDHYENEQLREDVNYELMGRVDKRTIIEIARRQPEAVRRWTVLKEEQDASSYDLASDPRGVWQWDLATSRFAEQNPLTLSVPRDDTSFLDAIEQMVGQFHLFIEEQGGWRLLWNDGGLDEKPEEAAQLLFRGIVGHYCRANNISLDAEVNLGRGPVDFKFSNGYQRRAHLEMKKLENTRFWNGLRKQLPSYMRSDEVTDGWFVTLRFRDGKPWDLRARELPEVVQRIAHEQSLNLRFRIVDARPKESASRL